MLPVLVESKRFVDDWSDLSLVAREEYIEQYWDVFTSVELAQLLVDVRDLFMVLLEQSRLRRYGGLSETCLGVVDVCQDFIDEDVPEIVFYNRAV